MTVLYAQPYNISAQGFSFEDEADYNERAKKNFDCLGFPIEEYEIQFIDGESIDAQLFDALKINQGNFGEFFTACKEWDDHQKRKVIIATGECGYSLDLQSGDPDDFEVDIYEVDNLRELAVQFVDEGLFGEIPEHLQYYLDYDAMARDLAMDYAEIVIAGNRFVYRCS
ncbi:MAG: antirestriction protein ArdA [Chthoniobacteraceae bacterium]|jgi:antirestriction protein